jgi:phosphatidylglycerol lysyltransferase
MTGEAAVPPAHSTLRRRLTLLIDAGLFLVSLGVLHRVLRDYHYTDVVAAMRELGGGPLLLSLLVTVAGYSALVGYDYISLRLVGHPLPLRRMAIPSFISFAVANSAPLALLTAGGLRYRLFGGLGLTPGQTAKVTLANLLTYVLGLFSVAGAAFLLTPLEVPSGLGLPGGSLRVVGALFVLLVLAALVLSIMGRRGIGFRRWRVEIPPVPQFLAQVGVSSADWLLCSASLYVLLAATGPTPYLRFLAAFLLAQIVTQAVPLPGGIGVVEAIIILFRPPGASVPAVAAALLLFRVTYYLIPLIAAATALAWRVTPPAEGAAPKPAADLARLLVPHLLAVLTFLGGSWLLLFGALPADPGRLVWLGRLLPLAVIEGSHFAGSLIGTGLMLLAWGLAHRLQGAWRLTLLLMGLGIPVALFRAADLASAALLIVLALLLVATRHRFDRRIPLGEEPFDAAWGVALVLALSGIALLALFAQSHQEYSDSLWWRFALDGDAPRALRMALGVLVTTVVFSLGHLVTRARAHTAHKPAPPDLPPGT